MEPIFLIGFMGCGKSTLGCAVAHASGRRFVDLDGFIEGERGASVSDIFRSVGEDGFRAIEAEALRRVSRMDNVVVACGGGTACHMGNMDLMLGSGRVVWLNASRERLVVRLEEGKASRPLLAGLARRELETFIDRRLAERSVFYRRAQVTFNSSFLDCEDELARSAGYFCKIMDLRYECGE